MIVALLGRVVSTEENADQVFPWCELLTLADAAVFRFVGFLFHFSLTYRPSRFLRSRIALSGSLIGRDS